MKKEEVIYELATGVLVLEKVENAKLREHIEDEFETGKLCGEWYDQIYQLKNRLAERLGKEEDRDIEFILDRYSKICKHMAYKMYEYGKVYGN